MSVVVGQEVATSWNVYVNVGLEQTASWNVDAPTTPPPGPCQTVCVDDGICGPFRRVFTDFLVEGNARVHWELRPQFNLLSPLTTQLQVGDTGNPDADDWTDVGDPLVNTYLHLDPNRRAFGKQLTTHYRVQLTDGNGNIWLSPPATVLGQLTVRQWIWARDILRRESLRLRKWAGTPGWLFKRKRDGTPCTDCVDRYTGSVINSKCRTCNGTRFVAGYFRAMPCQFVDLGNFESAELRQPEGQTGMVSQTTTQGRFLGQPLLSTNDIWVNAASDLRYWVQGFKVEAQIRGVPIVITAALKAFPFNDIAYELSLEGTP